MRHATLMDSLKEAIGERHARMESLPFIVALTRGELPLESYVGQLRAMATIHGTLERELSRIDSGNVGTVLLDRPSRLVHLRKDLSLFDRLLVPDISAALGHTRAIAERIRRYRVEEPGDLLGVLYVLEGTTLGNAVHLRDVLRAFGDRTAGAAHYYAGYGDRTGHYWQQFCRAMNALPVDEEGRRRLARVALDFFCRLEPLFAALYPFDGTGTEFTAAMLNPEAGDHAVPSDAREIAAAEIAARKCREEFPYFDERYQDRGKGFARSDAAWLATLSELPGLQLMAQVEWLGRVLGNRGMPRITLERQLELLYDELVTAVPEKEDRYRGLLEAAAALKSERRRLIPDPVFTGLARKFQAATDGELQGRFRRTGELIVAAVCDEAAGIADAVNSLKEWLTDAERFSPQWIAAVSDAFGQARGNVRIDA